MNGVKMQTEVNLYKVDMQRQERDGLLHPIKNLTYNTIFPGTLKFPLTFGIDTWETEDVIRSEKALPTPAELSFALRDIRSKYGLAFVKYLFGGRTLYTVHGIGASNTDSQFSGKLIISPFYGVLEPLQKRTLIEPDYDRAVVINHKLIDQIGFISKWEIVGEYFLADGTKQYLSFPFVGHNDEGLGMINMTRVFKLRSNEDEFFPLAFGLSDDFPNDGFPNNYELQKRMGVRIMPVIERGKVFTSRILTPDLETLINKESISSLPQ